MTQFFNEMKTDYLLLFKLILHPYFICGVLWNNAAYNPHNPISVGAAFILLLVLFMNKITIHEKDAESQHR